MWKPTRLVRRRSVGAAATALGGVAAVGSLACSSLPFVPREGAGANLNLATVGYVQESQEEVREELREDLLASLPEAIDARLVEDRRRITRLQEGALARQEKMDAVEQRLAEARAGLEAVAEEMRREAEAFRSAAAEMQALRQRLDDALRELPTRALEQLQLAIESHLSESVPPPDDASEPNAPAERSDEDGSAGGG